jgi:hypothetical protein
MVYQENTGKMGGDFEILVTWGVRQICLICKIFLC